MSIIFILLILFQLKHFLADYPLQVPYMLGKFKDKGWVLPLAAHCAVHALMTFIIVAAFGNVKLALQLAILDFVVHFIMDRLKAGSKYLGRYKALSGNEFMTLLREKQTIEKLQLTCDDCEITRNGNGSDAELKIIDRKFKHNQYFWYALGLDQTVHHLTHYAIIFLMVVL